MEPTRIYVKSLLNIIKNFHVKGIVNIVGGGFYDNIPRSIPHACCCIIDKSWDIPPIFKIIQEMGNIEERECSGYSMGIGMMIIVPEKECQDVLEQLKTQLWRKSFYDRCNRKREDDQQQVVLIES